MYRTTGAALAIRNDRLNRQSESNGMNSSCPERHLVPDWECYPAVTTEKESTMNSLGRAGIDLAKNVFRLRGVDRHGKAVRCRRLTRGKWLRVLLENPEPGCAIAMQACAGAHHWSGVLQAKGFTVRLIAPRFMKPCVDSNKSVGKRYCGM